MSERLPLSFGQKRLWFLHQLEGPNPVHNIPAALRIEGELDEPALQRALQAVVARHESLRTIFTDVDGTPYQDLLASADVPWTIAAATEHDLADQLSRAATTPIDITHEIPIRAFLFVLAPREHVLLLTLHHIAADGWSLGILLRDLAQALAGETLAELPVQYSDYTLWQQDLLESVAEEQLAFWKNALRGLPEELNLPVDRVRPAIGTNRGASVPLHIDVELQRALRDLARDTNASLFMLMHAALAAFLQRHGAGDDIPIGTAVAGRADEALEALIGLFINSLTLRTDVSGEPTFRELIARVKAFDLEAYEHQDLPFERVVDALQPARSLSRHPLFQVLLQVHSFPAPDVELPGLRMRTQPLEATLAKFDLTVELYEQPWSLEGRFEVSLDLFDAASATTLRDRFVRFLRTAVTDPDVPLRRLPLLDAHELHVLDAWNDTAHALPQATMVALIEERAASQPDAIAVVDEREAITYRELNARASQLAHELIAQGAGPERVVGVQMERSVDLVIALLGTMKSGAAYLPLDVDLPQARIDAMLADAKPVVVLRSIERSNAPATNPNITIDARHPAYVIYTSGSTGTPKGAPNTHGALLNRILWMQDAYRLDASDVVLQKTPFSFDVSVWEFFWPLAFGARLVMAAPRRHGDPAYLASLIAAQRVTTLHFVPSMLRAFLEHAPMEECASLRRVICSGEALPGDVQSHFLARLPHAELHNLYGPTEAAIDVTSWPCSAADGNAAPPIGRPIWNTRMYVLDAALQPVPIGVAGELYIAGAGLARGYCNRPSLTAQRFVADPFAPGERMYRTGDLARWRHDGALDYLGRVDSQVKIRGFRIELTEIEAALDAQPSVVQSAVVARPQLVAYIVANAPVTPSQLSSALAKTLPEYMVPSAYVMLDAMPLSPNGKLDRKALPAPDVPRETYVAPRTDEERVLCEIVASILSLEHAGVTDNFFTLGGDSILSIQLVSRARRAGLDLTPRDVFRAPTIEAMAAIARPALSARAPDADEGIGSFPVTPIMRWLLARERIDAFSQSMRITVPDDLTEAAMLAALQTLLDTHDMLRMRLDGGTIDIAPRGSVRAEDVLRTRTLDPRAGVVIAAEWTRGSVLLTIHHLAVDGVSWRVLAPDLVSACTHPHLDPVPVPFRTWAQLLAVEAEAQRTLDQLPFWSALAERGAPLIAGATLDPHRDTFGSASRLRITLTPDLTAKLLTTAPAALHAKIDELLLAAFARAINKPLLVDVEDHGRDVEGVDLSRTAGWFTNLYPVALDGGGDAIETLLRIKHELRAIPERGLRFGFLRDRIPQRAQVAFNYLGRFDGLFEDGDDAIAFPLVPLAHLLTVDAITIGETLSATFTFAPAHLSTADVQELADAWQRALEELALAAENGARALAPSDFPLVALTQHEVDALAREYPQLTDVLPLSPLQEGLLFHAQYDSAAPDVYTLQHAFTLEGTLDVARLREAASAMLRRHPNLRASFRQTTHGPVQILERDGALPWTEVDAIDEQTFLAADRAERFALETGPLLRFTLVQHSASRHLLVFTLHHIVMDGWSLPLFIRELFALYRGDRTLPFAPPYSSYLQWLAQQDRNEAREAWREHLDGVTSATRMTSGIPAIDRAATDRVETSIDAMPALTQLARERGVTLNTIVQALWAPLLARATGRDDVTFGITVSGRPAELDGIERMVGLFINTIPLRVRLRDAHTFSDLLAAIHQSQTRTLAYQHLGLGEIQQAAGTGELFDTLLVFENYPVDASTLDAPAEQLRIAAADAHDATHYPLSVMAVPGDELQLRIDGAAARSIAAKFTRLAAEVLAHPDAPIAQLLRDETTIPQLFAAQVARAPHAIAVVFEDESLTYAELDARANRLAHRLIADGVGPETLAGVMLERSVEMIVAVLAIVKAGGAYVPIAPSLPAARREAIVRDAGLRHVITRDTIAGDDDRDPNVVLLAQHPAYVNFTSGSTGAPKGVLVPHAAVVRLVRDASYVDLTAETRILQFAPLSFDAATFEIWGALLSGGTLVIAPAETASAEELGEVIAQQRVDTLWLTSGLFHQMADYALPSLAGVRQLLAGGDVLSPDRVRRVLDAHPQCRFIAGYGPTENTTFTSCTTITRETDLTAGVPLGIPIDETRAYVLDADLHPVRAGERGELYVAGTGLARGYLRSPARTAERFVANPFEPGARMYRTGDLASFSNGVLEFHGRADSQVKIRGFRIEPAEVEAALMSDPHVAQAAVVPREDGSGKQLVAYIVPRDGHRDELALRDSLTRQLPDYMVPASIVYLDALPLTAHGKLDRRALPQPSRTPSTLTPRTREEAQLCTIFAEVLGIPGIGLDDDFFANGGHSLSAMRAVSRIRTELGFEVSIRTLYEAPSVAALASKITARADARPALTRQPRPDRIPMSYAQQRLWFLGQLEGPSATYNIVAALRLRGELDARALELAVADVVARHESLRTIFPDRFQSILIDPRPSFVIETVSEADLHAHLADQARRPIDPMFELPLRVRLYRIGEREHVVLLVVHHIAADGWSIDPLTHDLRDAYEARRRNEAPRWDPLPVQYADYAIWQRTLLESRMESQLAFWRNALAGAPEELKLPTDRPRPAVASHRGGWAPVRIDADVHTRLTELARTSGASLFMLLHAAVAALLARHGAGEDIPIGTVVAGRGERALEGLIGFFVNTLVLRADLRGNPTFRELLARVKAFDLDAYQQQDVPFDRVVEALDPVRSLARQPLFQVLLALQNTPPAEVQLDGLTIEPESVATGVAKFDLTFELVERTDAIDGGIEYSEDLFDPATAEALAARFARLLVSIADHPDARLHELAIVDDREERVLLGFGRGLEPHIPDASLAQLFEAQVDRDPHAIAIVSGATSIPYAELDQRANALAHDLLARGVSEGSCVAVRLERNPQLIVALLAIVKCGAAYVPLDLSYPPERTRFMLEDSGAKLLLTEIELDRTSAVRPSLAPSPQRVAYVMYSSGSTGTPKGIAVPEGAVKRLVLDTDYVTLAPGDRIAQASNSSFDAATFEIWGALLNGATLVLLPRDVTLSATALAAALHEQKIDTLFLTTALFNQIAREAPHAFSGLRDLLFGGELVDPEWVRRALSQPKRLLHVYGPTECTTFSTWELVREVGESTVPIGRPIANTHCRILDAWLTPVPLGVPGDLYISGPGLAHGYHQRVALTAERFVADPHATQPGARMYRTGDLARWNVHGSIEFLGRADEQVKIRGFRIELGEIEAALRAHPLVTDVGMMVREDIPGVKQLVAYLTGTARESDLRTHLAERLPEYMIPSFFVTLDALPLTPNGKLDRKALPAPSRESTSIRAPRTREEEILCRIFADVLHVERVGIDDNFFTLGGDSIQSILVVSQARQAGLELGARDVFLRQTVEGLAAVARRVEAIVADADDGIGEVPLTPVMRWFLGRNGPKQRFSQSMELAVPHDASEAQLVAALQSLLDHHDTLRMRLDGARMFITPRGSVDAHSCFASSREEAEQALDPEAGIVLRAVHTPGRLFLTIHHLAIDGVSWRILATHLDALLRGESLPPVLTSFRRWAQHLEEDASAPQTVAQLPEWETNVRRGAPWRSGTRLDDADTFASAGHFRTELPRALTHALLTHASAAFNARLHEVLLAALAVAAGGRLLINVEGHGREAEQTGLDLTRTIGWFTSVYPVGLDAGSGAPGTIVKRIKEQLRSVPGHGLGYGQLRYLNDTTAPRLAALDDPQLAFNYLGRFHGAGDVFGGGAEDAMPLFHLLELNALTIDSDDGPRLTAHWMWARRHFRELDVRELAMRWQLALEALVADVEDGAFGHTPSDFPLVPLTQSQIEMLEASYSDLEAVLPLTPLQEGLLFHAQFDADVYTVQLAVELEGALDASRLRRAAEAMLRRHANLRAVMVREGVPRPVQVIPQRVDLPWRELDLGDRDLAAFLAEEQAEPFDLARGPLVRFTLVKLANDRHLLVFTNHHILLDGWSTPLFFDELLTAYRDGGTDALPLVRPYADYLGWLARQDRNAALDLWREHLADLEGSTRISTKRTVAIEPHQRERTLDAPTTHALQQLARDRGLTLNTVIQGLWGVLLARLTGRTDVAFGITVSGRPADLPGVERMVGLFINTIPLRVRIDPAQTLPALLDDLQRSQARLLPAQHIGLADIQSAAGTGELFDTLIGFQNYPIDAQAGDSFDGVRVTNFFGKDATHYPLSLMATPGGEELGLRFYFDPDLDAQQIEERFVRLLQQAAHDPSVALHHLDVLDDRERDRVLTTFNDTHRDIEHATFAQLFAQQVERDPNAIALVHGAQSLTYGELNDRANRLAHLLIEQGAKPETVIGIALPRSLDMIAAVLAVLKSGAAYLPLDPEYPRARLAYMLEDAQPLFVITTNALRQRLPSDVPVQTLDAVDRNAYPAEEPRGTEELRGTHLAYVIYTSGSTGKPKAVAGTHDGVTSLSAAQREQFGVGPDARVLQFATLNFDASFWELVMALTNGATLVLLDDDQRTGEPLADVLRSARVTHATLPPAVLTSMPEVDALETLVVAGEACPESTVRTWSRNRRMINAYGPTETTVCATISKPLAGSDVPIGAPIANARVYVLDAALRPVPEHVTGELYIAGPALARGYRHQPALTAERFVADPFGPPGARMYRSGDLARWRPDGQLDFLGRADGQVKLRGFRIELGEIEAALLRESAIAQAVAVVRKESTGDRLYAYVVPRDSMRIDESAVLASLRSQLTEAMVPSAIVTLDAFPLTPSGKLDKRALPAPVRRIAAVSTTAWSPFESLVGDVWKRILDLDRVDLDENFFDLGGQSLLAAAVLTELRKRAPALAIVDLFRHPTVRTLAAHLQRIAAPEPAQPAAADSDRALRDRVRKQQKAMRLYGSH